jgi:quercetin dioxygenase-like cupin family protein
MKTSFGELEILFKTNNKPQVEYLRFNSNGRLHQHSNYESFFVTKGRGMVVIGKNWVSVKEGDVVTIPPLTAHWMEPDPDNTMEGLLWYHEQPLNTPAFSKQD